MSETGPDARQFATLRYAQCWEDADVLLAGLEVQPGETCLSIASAGDNALALLTADPARVIAIDLNPTQLAALALRVSAYRTLNHAELVQLIGSQPCADRAALYQRCRPTMPEEARRYWDARPEAVAAGIGGAGRFERYFALFRRWVLPLIHRRSTVWQLLAGGEIEARRRFYETRWDNRRWRWLFRLFFSRFVMGRLGRSPAFFKYVQGPVADRLMQRARHALVELDPAANPYLQWILTGGHTTALPLALRPEHFTTIRDRLDRLEWREQSLDTFLADRDRPKIDRFNLSDVFEYLDPAACERLLDALAAASRPGGRLAYWNMLAPRSRPDALADRLAPLDETASVLHARDKAFFYSRFVLEAVR